MIIGGEHGDQVIIYQIIYRMKGKIIGIASGTGWLPVPRMSINNVTHQQAN